VWTQLGPLFSKRTRRSTGWLSQQLPFGGSVAQAGPRRRSASGDNPAQRSYLPTNGRQQEPAVRGRQCGSCSLDIRLHRVRGHLRCFAGTKRLQKWRFAYPKSERHPVERRRGPGMSPTKTPRHSHPVETVPRRFLRAESTASFAERLRQPPSQIRPAGAETVRHN